MSLDNVVARISVALQRHTAINVRNNVQTATFRYVPINQKTSYCWLVIVTVVTVNTEDLTRVVISYAVDETSLQRDS